MSTALVNPPPKRPTNQRPTTQRTGPSRLRKLALALAATAMFAAIMSSSAVPEAEASPFWRVISEHVDKGPVTTFTSRAPYTSEWQGSAFGGFSHEVTSRPPAQRGGSVDQQLVTWVLHDHLELTSGLNPFEWDYEYSGDDLIQYRQHDVPQASGCDHSEFRYERVTTELDVEYTVNGMVEVAKIQIVHWELSNQRCLDDNNSGSNQQEDEDEDEPGVAVKGHCGACHDEPEGDSGVTIHQ